MQVKFEEKSLNKLNSRHLKMNDKFKSKCEVMFVILLRKVTKQYRIKNCLTGCLNTVTFLLSHVK